MEILIATFMGAFDQSTPLSGQQGTGCRGDYRPTEILRCFLPILFHNQITYDGQCRYYNVVFGGGTTHRLHDTSQLAQAQYGIITSLPLEAQAVAPNEEEQLRFYRVCPTFHT